MYIEKIKVDKFRVLEDIEIHFQPPGGATADPETGNVVNVIAGVNGTGKTTVLNAIYDCLIDAYNFSAIKKHGDVVLDGINLDHPNVDFPWRRNTNYRDQMSQYAGMSGASDLPRLIYIPAQLTFTYNSRPFVSIEYQYINKIDINQILGDAEVYIKEFVFSKERASNIADSSTRSKYAVQEFNEKFLDANLLTKLVDLDASRLNRPVFENARNEKVTIDQLSDGEKQLYGRVIALMMLEPMNSVILIDEPEIALHPAWQQKIMQIYSRIGKNNQFIVATHSPQIIANTPYQNLIILKKSNDKIVRFYPTHPPIGTDVNSILDDFMGVSSEFPDKVVALHKAYREKVEQGLEKTESAEGILTELLKYESNDSRFMQEMRILMRLRGKK